jgi:hypothetical protein
LVRSSYFTTLCSVFTTPYTRFWKCWNSSKLLGYIQEVPQIQVLVTISVIMV